METRPAITSDLPRLLDLAETFFDEADAPGTFDRHIASATICAALESDAKFLVVLDPGNDLDLFGAGMAEAAHVWAREPFAYLHYAYVEPKSRGVGAGRLLIASLVGWARAMKCAAVFAGSNAGMGDGNTTMFANQLRRAGFVDDGPNLIRRF